MVPVARKNLLADKVRLLISVGGVTFAVLLVLVVLSLYRGFERAAGSFPDRVSADIWVMQSGAKDLFHSSFSLIPASVGDQLRSLNGVNSVTALYGRRLSVSTESGEADLYVMAVDLPPEVSPMHGIEAGARPGQIIVDSVFSRKTGIGRGGRLVIE